MPFNAKHWRPGYHDWMAKTYSERMAWKEQQIEKLNKRRQQSAESRNNTPGIKSKGHALPLTDTAPTP